VTRILIISVPAVQYHEYAPVNTLELNAVRRAFVIASCILGTVPIVHTLFSLKRKNKFDLTYKDEAILSYNYCFLELSWKKMC
jgi:hypothetical protein